MHLVVNWGRPGRIANESVWGFNVELFLGTNNWSHRDKPQKPEIVLVKRSSPDFYLSFFFFFFLFGGGVTTKVDQSENVIWKILPLENTDCHIALKVDLLFAL